MWYDKVVGVYVMIKQIRCVIISLYQCDHGLVGIKTPLVCQEHSKYVKSYLTCAHGSLSYEL